MCLLLAVPAGSTVDPARLHSAALANPHGFGWALVSDSGLLVSRSLDIDEAVDTYCEALASHSGPSLFHLRYATHGSRDLHNVHPFELGTEGSAVLAHNGVLDIATRGRDSDTRAYAQTLDPSRLSEGSYLRTIQNYAVSQYSRFVILRGDVDPLDQLLIFNEGSGHWDQGVWWSNHSYEHYADADPRGVSSRLALADDELMDWGVEWLCESCGHELDCWDCGSCEGCGDWCLCWSPTESYEGV